MHADTVGEVTTALADVSTTQAELSESIEDVKAQTGTSLTALYAAIAIEAIVLVLVAVVLIRKRT